MTTTAARILTKAADHMQQVGWTRHRMFEKHDIVSGRCCLFGALHIASHDSIEGKFPSIEDQDMAAFMLAELIRKKTSRGVSIPTFNDHYCKSKDEAVRTLREAAALAEVAP